MSETYDAVIIGAGVIGAAVSYELAKKGWKTVNIDRNPTAGYGSTSASCAIIRVHYSTYDGTALAYEGIPLLGKLASSIWKPRATTALPSSFSAAVWSTRSTPTTRWKPSWPAPANWACRWKNGPTSRSRNACPSSTPTASPRPRLLDDPDFGKKAGGEIYGAVHFPTAGYVNDPQLVGPEHRGGLRTQGRLVPLQRLGRRNPAGRRPRRRRETGGRARNPRQGRRQCRRARIPPR